jgi:hypothetical protein
VQKVLFDSLEQIFIVLLIRFRISSSDSHHHQLSFDSTAENTPPATAKYPATLTTTVGKTTGAAIKLPLKASKVNQYFSKS